MNAQEQAKPWYTQALVWMIIAIPGGTIIAGLITLAIAFKTDDGTVVDDYYQEGKAINLVLERDQNAAHLKIQGSLSYNADSRRVQLHLASPDPQALTPPTVKLQLLHATKGGHDQQLNTSLDEHGNALIELSTPLIRGPWVIETGTDQWRVVGRIQIPQSPVTALTPKI